MPNGPDDQSSITGSAGGILIIHLNNHTRTVDFRPSPIKGWNSDEYHTGSQKVQSPLRIEPEM